MTKKPKGRRRTVYVLSRIMMNYQLHGSPQHQDLLGWAFSSFKEANAAMADDWVATYDSHRNSTPHADCEVPSKDADHAWLQFDDGDLEFVWSITKGAMNA